MRFLAPLFLMALVAIGIPIVLHLIQREKREAVPFPSLMFLQKIPHRSTRRRRLRDLPLLLLRVAALALLAAAFARPLLERHARLAANAGARELVLLLDRSYSMSAGQRWQEARSAALREIGSLRPGDRATIVAFDASAAALNTATGDVARLRALVAALQPGAGTTRFDPALRLAADLVGASDLPRREVVLISDLQRGGAGEGMDVRLPPGTAFRAVVPGPVTASNLALADVSFRRTPFGGQERVVATARVVNPGAAPVRAAPLSLELDGRPVQTTRVDVPAHGAASVELTPFTLARPMAGSVRLGADALPADDAWRFTLRPGEAISVLVLDDRPGRSLFLTRALAAAAGEPGFSVSVRTGALGEPDLRDRDVVVLDGTAPRGAGLKALTDFVARGGGLVVAAGPDLGPGELAALLPGALGAIRDRTSAGGATLSAIQMTHAVFDVFRGPHAGDLSGPRFYRYRPIEVRAQTAAGSSAVLARFDDGAVALAERRIGRGRVLVWGSTLDREWSDLPVNPLFVPLTQRLLQYAAAFSVTPPARKVGDVVDPGALTGQAGAVAWLAPDGARGELPAGRTLALAQQGLYTLRSHTGDAAPPVRVAVNVDVAESEQATWTPAEFASMVAPPGPTAASSSAAPAASLTAQERERRQSLWWWVLLGVVVLLAVETVLSGRRAAGRWTASGGKAA